MKEYTSHLVRSTEMIFEEEAHLDLKRKDIERKNELAPAKPITIVIGVSGSVNGQIVFSMERDFAYLVTEAMMVNGNPDEVGQMVNSAICEIANMITGRATIEWAGDDGRITVTPPAIFIDSDMEAEFLQVPTVSLNFASEIGALEIDLALQAEDERGSRCTEE
ncbi:MAG: hypothetical protein B6D68_02935 [spirochete symbiont of Stewartia floridana]|nr:MAG: hypothetical protein B6D68_02935 [spirochete symbiont of Stewartia floridana]